MGDASVPGALLLAGMRLSLTFRQQGMNIFSACIIANAKPSSPARHLAQPAQLVGGRHFQRLSAPEPDQQLAPQAAESQEQERIQPEVTGFPAQALNAVLEGAVRKSPHRQRAGSELPAVAAVKHLNDVSAGDRTENRHR
jgi:hypothetical protein